ncbi:hypothetical protein C8T65DRAFT_832415 [Cerioporus squamosus]|nr:hypothetical protein C8T65DRAFT_832415 [Cerioporus squamosus]
MSSQLESYSISQPFVNSTQKAPFIPASDAPFTAPRSAVWINALWFSSLVCTLSASSIAVLVKQWLHQYSQSLSGTSPEVARLRQYRYDSLLKWHVREIIAALPMLLQLALSLFLSGLLILLWTLNSSVAIPASLFVGLLIFFTAATTVLPIFYRDCCYQSPQALSFSLLAQTVARAASKILRVVERSAHQAALDTTSWTSRKYVALARIRDSTRVLLAHLQTLGSFSDWQTREKPDADAKYSELEQSLALTAYYITRDNSMLNTTIVQCLSEMHALSARMSMRYSDLLRDVTTKLSTHEWKVWRPVMPFVLSVLSLITCEPRKGAVRKVLQAMPRQPACALKSRLGMLYLLAMSQLVARRIAAREAFHRILVYLQKTCIDTEMSLVPGSSILEDVEATFPLKPVEIEELVDLDRTESVSYYLTGIEYTVKYLLQHRDDLVKVFQEALSVIEMGYIAFGDGTGEAASRGARRALTKLQEDLGVVVLPLPQLSTGAVCRGATDVSAAPSTPGAGASGETMPPEGEAEILAPWADMINDQELAITIPELGGVHGSSDFPDSPLADPYIHMRRIHAGAGRKRLRLGRAVSYELPPELSMFERRPLPPVPETTREEPLESMLLLFDRDEGHKLPPRLPPPHIDAGALAAPSPHITSTPLQSGLQEASAEDAST